MQISLGTPALLLVGLPDKAVGRHANERAALTAMGLALPPRRVLIDLAPADLLKEGSHFDLPLHRACSRRWMWCRGRTSLATRRSASWRWTVAKPCRRRVASGHRRLEPGLGLICPASQGGEAAWAGRIEVLAAADLLSLINHFRGTQVLTPPEPAGVAEPRGPDSRR